jgi:hypothetical protein
MNEKKFSMRMPDDDMTRKEIEELQRMRGVNDMTTIVRHAIHETWLREKATHKHVDFELSDKQGKPNITICVEDPKCKRTD